MLFISSKVLYNIHTFSSHRAASSILFAMIMFWLLKVATSHRYRLQDSGTEIHLKQFIWAGWVEKEWLMVVLGLTPLKGILIVCHSDPFERDSDCLSFLNLFHSLSLSPLAGFIFYLFLSLHCFWSRLSFFLSRHPVFKYLLCSCTTYSVVCAGMWWIDASSLAKWLRVDSVCVNGCACWSLSQAFLCS